MPKTLDEQIEDLEKELAEQEEPNGKDSSSVDDGEGQPEEDDSEGTEESGGEGAEEGEPEGGTEESGGEGAEEGEPEGGADGKPGDSEKRTEDKDGEAPEGSKESAEDEGLNPSAAAFARMRREKRELQAKLAQIEASKAAPAVAQVAKPEPEKAAPADPEPDKSLDPDNWKEWKIRQLESKLEDQAKWVEEQRHEKEVQSSLREAVAEFQGYENKFRLETPDYDKAMEHGRQRYGDALRLMHPSANDQQIEQMVDMQILKVAGQAAARGMNPAEVLYDFAIERLGYNPKKEQPEAKQEQKQQRPELGKIAANRKRSASPLSGGGHSGKGAVSLEEVSEMSLADFSKLSPEYLAQLESA